MGNFLMAISWSFDEEEMTLDEVYNEIKQFLDEYPNEDLVIGLKDSIYCNMHLWDAVQMYKEELSSKINQYGHTTDIQDRTVEGVLTTDSFTVWRSEEYTTVYNKEE